MLLSLRFLCSFKPKPVPSCFILYSSDLIERRDISLWSKNPPCPFHFSLWFACQFAVVGITSHQSSVGSPLPGRASWLTLGIAGGTTLTPAFYSFFFPLNMPAYLKVSLLTTSDLKHWNRSLELRTMIISSASLCLSWDLQPGSVDAVQCIWGHAGHEGLAYLLKELPAAASNALGLLCFPQQRAERGQMGIWRASC